MKLNKLTFGGLICDALIIFYFLCFFDETWCFNLNHIVNQHPVPYFFNFVIIKGERYRTIPGNSQPFLTREALLKRTIDCMSYAYCTCWTLHTLFLSLIGMSNETKEIHQLISEVKEKFSTYLASSPHKK